MRASKNPKVDLKLQYRKNFELALVFSIAFHLSVFVAKPAIDAGPVDLKSKALQIEVADIPVTQQVKLPPPPTRPSVPVPTENEGIPEDVTIETTELDWDLTELRPPPPPDEDMEKEYVFVSYDEPPTLIGGFAAILKKLRYPELAIKAGIEARVVVGVLIDKNGNPIKTQVLKSSGSPIPFDERACEAVMQTKWKPAKQRDRTVKVWVSVPIRFKLRQPEKVTSL